MLEEEDKPERKKKVGSQVRKIRELQSKGEGRKTRSESNLEKKITQQGL